MIPPLDYEELEPRSNEPPPDGWLILVMSLGIVALLVISTLATNWQPIP